MDALPALQRAASSGLQRLCRGAYTVAELVGINVSRPQEALKPLFGEEWEAVWAEHAGYIETERTRLWEARGAVQGRLAAAKKVRYVSPRHVPHPKPAPLLTTCITLSRTPSRI